MIRATVRRRAGVGGLAIVSSLLSFSAGCGETRRAPVRVVNARLGPLTIAVAPAMNFSGSSAFDRNAVADIMASELSGVGGVEVIPVSRVLAVLERQGREHVASPAHALDIVNRLGADAVLVFAVTEYEPYNPPVVGIAAQLYGVRRLDAAAGVDPVRISREPRPSPASASPAPFGPLAQSERVFDASHAHTAERVREFAHQRGAHGSPFGWRLYLVSQRHYLRFCCYSTLKAMFESDPTARVAQARHETEGETK